MCLEQMLLVHYRILYKIRIKYNFKGAQMVMNWIIGFCKCTSVQLFLSFLIEHALEAQKVVGLTHMLIQNVYLKMQCGPFLLYNKSVWQNAIH